ncbi:MAG: hypothetical protein GY756_19650 [bacterium]|nr:hypothetical protein [bacterium]
MTSTKELQLDFIRNNCSNTIMNLLLLSHGEAGSEEYKKNYYDLLKLPVISYWKNKIPTEINITTILGSSDSCFENSFGKLVSFGLSVNDILSPALQGKYVLFLDTDKSNDIYDSIARFVVAGYLYAADCSYDTVDKIITNRINTLYDFVTHSPIKYKSCFYKFCKLFGF